MADTILHAEKSNSRKFISGVKSRSSLIDLLKFDVIHSYVPDSMHACNGVVKPIAKSLIGTKDKVGLLSRPLIPTIDNCLANIKGPHQVGRLNRPFSEKKILESSRVGKLDPLFQLANSFPYIATRRLFKKLFN